MVVVGKRLRQARECTGLEVAEVARLLRLGERQVEAIEQGNLSLLPGKTFVRGFVRNYARAVSLDSGELLELLDGVSQLSDPGLDLPASTHVAMPEQGKGLNRDLVMVIAGLLLVGGAIGAYFFLPDQFWLHPQAPETVTVAVAPQPAPNEPVFPPSETQGNGAPSVESGSATEQNETGGNPVANSVPVTPVVMTPPVVAPAQATVAVPAPAAPIAPIPPAPTPVVATPAVSAPPAALPVGSALMELSFAKDSWVEIKDKDGNVVASRLYPAGTVKELSGMPPFSLVLGNASGVQLKYKGQPVTLQPNAESDVARLTLP